MQTLSPKREESNPVAYFSYLATLILFVLLTVIVQQFLPVLTGLNEARILLLPVLFLCIVVTTNVPTMLLMAFLCGFLWDAQHFLSDSVSDSHIYTDPVPTLKFGYSILLYAGMGFIMQGIQPLFKNGIWYVSILLAGVSLFLYLLVEFLLLTFVRGGFIYNKEIFLRMLISAGITMPFSLLIFIGLFKLAKATKYHIRYEGLQQKNRLNIDHTF